MSSSQKIWRVGTLTYTTASLCVLFGWLLWGNFAWLMKDRTISQAATLLFHRFNTDDFIYTLVIVSFPNFTNIFLVPIIGYISDRHRGRFGRRIPFLAFTTPFVVLGACGLGFVPTLGEFLFRHLPADTLSFNACCLIFFALFWAILDFGATLAGALSGALINDVVPEKVIGRFYGCFRAVSLLAGVIFGMWIMGYIEKAYFWVFLGIGIFYGIGLTCLCLNVKEGEYPPVNEPPIKKVTDLFTPLVTYFRQSFSMPYYRWAMCAMVISNMAAHPLNMFALFYIKSDAIGMSVEEYGHILAHCYCVSFLLSYILGALADRFHPIRATLVTNFFYFWVMLAGWFVVRDHDSFKVIMYAHTIVSGCYYTVSSSITQRIFPRSLYAQFGSAQSLIAAIAAIAFSTSCGKFMNYVHSDYRYVYLIGSIVSLLSVLLMAKVLFNYNRLGGDKGYVAPVPK